MTDNEHVDEPRREKSNIDSPQEEFIDDGTPSSTKQNKPKEEGIWDDSWRPEDKAMESAEKEALGEDQDGEV